MILRIRLVLALGVAILPATVWAGNSNSFFLGNDAAMTAGALPAVVRDAESIWYNPAGMGGNTLTRLDLSANAFMIRFQNIPNGVRVELPSGNTQQDVKGNEFLSVPTAITFMRKATDRVSYGFGVFMPQFQDISLGNSLQSTETFPTIVEPVIYKQGFDYDSLNMEYQLGGAVGWQVSETLRLGGSMFLVYDRLRTNVNEFEDIASADGSDTTSLFYTGTLRVLMRTFGIRGTAGLQWEPLPHWRLGLVAFSPTFQLATWGDITTMTSGTTTISSGAVIQAADRVSTTVKEWNGDMVEPFHSQIAFGYTQPEYWIGASADFFLPLKKTSMLIDKRFNWNVNLGSKFKVSDTINMGAGFFTDRSDSRTPTSFAAAQINYYGLTCGAEFKTPISRGDNKPAIVFATTVAGRYALGYGKVGGQLFNPVTDGSIATARTTQVNSTFQEFSLYLGTSLFY